MWEKADINFLKTAEGMNLAVHTGSWRCPWDITRRGSRERRDEVLRTGRAPLVSLPGSPVY